jgi:membrane-associated phospholipid phosphatase
MAESRVVSALVEKQAGIADIEPILKSPVKVSQEVPHMRAGETPHPAKTQQHIFYGLASVPVEWTIILAVALADAILLAATSFRLEASSELRILAGSIVLAVILVYFRWGRFPRFAHPGPARLALVLFPRLADLARTSLVLVLFTYAAAILNFILSGILPLPRWDGALAAADHALGLNWLDMYQWLPRHPAIEATLHTAYMALGPELLILLAALELLGHHNQARAFLLWFMVAAIATLGIATLIPAAGPVVYYDLPVPSNTVYVSQMADLRNGTLRTINPFDGEGLVVFPSFHTVLAVLCACAAWPLRILKIPFLALNLLIILSCPAIGHHYFIDIIAGIILAALTIRLSGYILRETGTKEGVGAGKHSRGGPSRPMAGGMAE